jgi:hypothetical protein
MPGETFGPMSDGRIEMRVQRHDAHERGYLTPEGHEHARLMADENVNKYLDKNPDTNFMVIASDQVFDDAEPDFGGIRAQETADEVTSAIRDALEQRGLPADHLFGSDGVANTSSPALREAGIFSNGFMKHLRDAYPDDNAWTLYYQDTDEQVRQNVGGESPRDLAMRMDYMIKTAEMVGTSFHRTPGKEDQPLVVWIVGHGGGLDSYLHHYANVPLDELGFDLSDGFSIRATEEQGVVAEVKGIQYPIKTDESLNYPS